MTSSLGYKRLSFPDNAHNAAGLWRGNIESNKPGVETNTMSGASAKTRNALTRAEADTILRTLPGLPKISKQRHNRM